MRRTSNGGFTLIELVIVLVLLGVITAIATPSFMHYMKSQRLSGACRQLFTDLTKARAQAVGQNCRIIIELTNSTDYKIIRDTNNNSVIDTGETGETRSIRPTYHDVTFSAATAATSFTPIFYPNGTGNNGTISVTSSSLSQTKTITFSTMGRIKIN